jgi:putative oxidoreductase
MAYALWFVQVVLALLFLSAGGAKLVVPVEALGMPFQLPAVFVHFIGVCEVLGAFALILPASCAFGPSLRRWLLWGL